MLEIRASKGDLIRFYYDIKKLLDDAHKFKEFKVSQEPDDEEVYFDADRDKDLDEDKEEEKGESRFFYGKFVTPSEVAKVIRESGIRVYSQDEQVIDFFINPENENEEYYELTSRGLTGVEFELDIAQKYIEKIYKDAYLVLFTEGRFRKIKVLNFSEDIDLSLEERVFMGISSVKEKNLKVKEHQFKGWKKYEWLPEDH